MQKTKQHGFTAIEILLVIALVGVIGVVGYQAWQQSMHKVKTQTSSSTTGQKTPAAKAGCADNETESATNGIFCSAQIGIKFAVPDIFKGKLAKAPNYEVFQGTFDEDLKASSAGDSGAVFSAEITGNDNFKLTIAQEPLRSGYIDVGHGLQGTYFNKTTGELNVVNGATYSYDSATDTRTQTSKASIGEAVPSFMVGSTRFYRADSGDAGIEDVTYVAVIKGQIIKIWLDHKGYIGDPAKDPSTIDASTVLKPLDDAVKKLQVI